VGIAGGDFDASGSVDLDDFVILKNNFGVTMSAPVAGVGDPIDLLADTGDAENTEASSLVQAHVGSSAALLRSRRAVHRAWRTPRIARRPLRLLQPGLEFDLLRDIRLLLLG